MSALGSFISLIGLGRSCGAYACEIQPQAETQPQRYLFEQLIPTINWCVTWRFKPWGFTYKVKDLSTTDQDIRSGRTQIDYRDQDSEIHEIFRAECAKRGTEVMVRI